MADNDQIFQMVRDPDFASLPIGEQRKALSAHDSTFSQVGDADLQKFVQAHQGTHSGFPSTTSTPAGTMPPPEATATNQDKGVLGGVVNRTIGIGKGAYDLVKPPETTGEKWSMLLGPGGPSLLRIGKGAINALKQTGPQVMDQVKTASNVPANNPGIKALSYARAGVTGLSMLDPFATASIGNVNQLQDAGKPGQAAGEGLTDIASLLVGGKGGKSGIKSLNTPAPELTVKSAAKTITDAINPPASEIPKFQGSIENQLPNILEHAKENGLAITNKADLAQVIKSAADAKRAAFQGKLESVKDVTVKLDDIPGYEGPTVGGGKATVLGPAGNVPTMTSAPQFGQVVGRGGIATLGQLYSRLNDLNGELFNSYNKSSARAANAAVRSHSDLAAEAAGVRKALYTGMGKALDVDPATLADMHKASGELGYLAEKSQLSADTERFMQNKKNQEPMKVSLVNPLSKDFLPDALANKLINKVRGNPANNAIGKVLSDALSKANALPPEDVATLARSISSAGESAVDEATRRGPGSPPSSAPDPAQSYSRPGGAGQVNVADMLKQALDKPGPASQQIKDLIAGNADRQGIASASNLNSPSDVAGFQQAAAQKLFGKDFAQLSVPQKLTALREATNLQNMKRGLYSNASVTNKR